VGGPGAGGRRESGAGVGRLGGGGRDRARGGFGGRDPDDWALRRVRVVGGAGGSEYRAGVTPARTRHWRARLSLEGLWSDEA